MDTHRVLLVEDEARDADRLIRCLDEMGCRVVATATNGEEALKEARLHKPNLVLMDIVLPGDMDGIETSHRIRDDMDIPIIYITAYSDQGYLDQVWDTDPFGYITKSCDADTLKASIRVALHRKSREEAVVESRERYRELLQMGGDPMVVFGAVDETIHYANEHLCTLVKCSAEEIIGSRVWDLFPKENELWYRSFITNISTDAIPQYEPMLLTRMDGSVIPVEASFCSGRVDATEMITLTFRDISQKNLEEWEKKLIDAMQRMTSTKRDVDEIYTMCAHCKKVKDSIHHWRSVESFFYHKLGIKFSHGICPECLSGFYAPPGARTPE